MTSRTSCITLYSIERCFSNKGIGYLEFNKCWPSLVIGLLFRLSSTFRSVCLVMNLAGDEKLNIQLYNIVECRCW